jgi:hypothetical protein
MKITSILFLSFFTISLALGQYKIELKDGIYIEKFDSTYPVKGHQKYSLDNITYVPHKEFTFSYKYFDKNGKEFRCKFLGNDVEADKQREQWTLVPKEKSDSSSLGFVCLTVFPNLGIMEGAPNYGGNTTVIQYDYLTEKSDTIWADVDVANVVENEKNIWLVPPRVKLFEILEINPFPFVMHPCKVGKKWTWKEDVGSQWESTQWKTWEGRLSIDYKYKISNEELIKTPMGDIMCFKINSTAISKLGSSSLTSYFNQTYGFVKWDFINIDKSQIIFDLIKVDYVENLKAKDYTPKLMEIFKKKNGID